MALFVLLAIAAFSAAAYTAKVETNLQKRTTRIDDRRTEPSPSEVLDLAKLGTAAETSRLGFVLLTVAALAALLHWVGWA